MNKRTLRRLLKWSFPANLVLFVLAILDYGLWDSQGMFAILSLYSLLLIAVIVILVLDATPAYRRVSLAHDDDGPRTIVYGRP